MTVIQQEPVTVIQQARSGQREQPRPTSDSDPRLPSVVCTVAVAVLLLAACGAALVGSHQSGPLTITALVLAIPVAMQVGGAAVDFALWLLADRRPAPPQLRAEAAAPALAATVVTYPVIVHGLDDVAALLDSVRATRLAAGDGFGMHLVLVDFADCDTPTRATDDSLRAAIESGLAELNAANPHRRGAGPPVAALFRHRRWNPHEGVFMGWERKRGKLEELTDLIAGHAGTSFDLDRQRHRDLAARLRGMRYLLTLDVGNRPLGDGLWRLVATIAHPDNAAVVDPSTGLVRRGFGFVRATDVPAAPSTVFEWALQPYPVPEGEMSLSQAVFGRDAFFGQGVIDVAAYRAVLAGRIPANRVLSHDKLEGMHGRAAVIADARVAEAGIPDYLQFRRREHRWIRGDTQLIPWIVAVDRQRPRRLPATDRFHLAKDIIGHLYPVALVGLLALGWLAAPTGQVGWWTLTLLAVLAHPMMIMALYPLTTAAGVYRTVRRHPPRRRPDQGRAPGRRSEHGRAPGRRPDHGRRRWLLPVIAGKSLQAAARLITVDAARLLVWLPLLADRAFVAVDAMCRAWYRMTVSHRHILQWTSSVRASRIEAGLAIRVRHLWPSCLGVLLLGLAVWLAGPARLVWAAPLLLTWLAAPVFAYRTARPARRLPRAG